MSARMTTALTCRAILPGLPLFLLPDYTRVRDPGNAHMPVRIMEAGTKLIGQVNEAHAPFPPAPRQ